jgi:HAD superfamily hydrolase (TIGR01490 family)
MVRRGLIPRTALAKLDAFYWAWVKRQGTYEDYLQEVIKNFVESLKKKTVREVESAAKRVVEVQSDIVYRYTRDLIKKLSKTHTLVALSGSPSIVVEAFAQKWGFEHFLATEYEVVDKEFTGKVIIVHAENKKKALADFVAEHNFSLKDSIGVGDTESDIGIFELVEQPLCFNPTAKLLSVARERGWKIVVERKDAIYEIQKDKLVNE